MNNWNQRSRGNYGNNSGGRDEPSQRFPNSGALFPVKQKRSDNSPDFTGNITIADDVLDYILREAQNGNEVQLEMSAWLRISRNNTNFTSLKINIPYAVRMEEGGNPVYRQTGGRPNFNRRQDDRQDQRQPQSRGNSYAQASGRTDRPEPQGRKAPQHDDEFSRGDRMPDFLRDRDDDDPNAPPF